jgi:hypothetical protein
MQIDSSEPQLEKARPRITDNDEPDSILNSQSVEQERKQSIPRIRTLDGTEIEANEYQFENACSRISCNVGPDSNVKSRSE